MLKSSFIDALLKADWTSFYGRCLAYIRIYLSYVSSYCIFVRRTYMFKQATMQYDNTYQSDTPYCAIVYPYRSVSLFGIPYSHLVYSLSNLPRASCSRVHYCYQPNTPLKRDTIRREKLVKHDVLLNELQIGFSSSVSESETTITTSQRYVGIYR